MQINSVLQVSLLPQVWAPMAAKRDASIHTQNAMVGFSTAASSYRNVGDCSNAAANRRVTQVIVDKYTEDSTRTSKLEYAMQHSK